MEGACQGTSSMLSQCVVVQSPRYKPLVRLHVFRRTYKCAYFVCNTFICSFVYCHPQRTLLGRLRRIALFPATSLWQRFCDGSCRGVVWHEQLGCLACPPQFISNFVSNETSCCWNVAVLLSTVCLPGLPGPPSGTAKSVLEAQAHR